jgi:acid phosphatase
MGQAASLSRPHFVASTGDNFYPFGVSSDRDSQWQSSFEAIYTADGLVDPPRFAVLGNHDYGGRIDAQTGRTGHGRWHMPGLWYSVRGAGFGRADVDLYFINTVVWLGKERFPFSWLGSEISSGEQQAQRAWLIAELAASTARYKLVFGHHGIYSIGPHGGEMRMKELDDVLRKYGVTAYVNGHDHCLYHISRDGLHYVCSGGGSKIEARYTGGRVSGCVLKSYCGAGEDALLPRWHCFIPDAGYAAFEISDQGLSFDLVGVNRGVSESYHWPPRQA